MQHKTLVIAYILAMLPLSARCDARDEVAAPGQPPDPCSIARLIEERAPFDQRDATGSTRLHCASNFGDSNGVRFLLARGASVEAATLHGTTPLMYAAQQGRSEVVELLLNAGANLENRDRYGGTALLHCAAFRCNITTLKLLLDRGANIDAFEQTGKNALVLAIEAKHAEAALLLVERGASCDQRDRDGVSAIILLERYIAQHEPEGFRAVRDACRRAKL